MRHAHVFWAQGAISGGGAADPEGRFTLEGVPEGTLRVHANDGGSRPHWVESGGKVDGIRAEGPPVRIVLTGARLLRIDFDFSPAPPRRLCGRIVVVRAADGARGLDTGLYSDVPVHYRIARPGDHRVTVTFPGYDPITRTVEIRPDREARLPLRFREER